MLKASVITMGVLILTTLVILIVTISNRWSANISPKISSQALKTTSVYDEVISLPQGAYIQNLILADNQIVLQLSWPDGRKGLLLLDVSTGRKIGTISFQ